MRIFWRIRTMSLLWIAALAVLPFLAATPVHAEVNANAVVSLLNAARAGVSAPALSIQPQLTAAAQVQADYLASGATFSHTGPGGSTPGSRLTAQGYAWGTVGENILLRGDEDARNIFAQWRGSPAHNANMMASVYRHVGVACASGTGSVYCVMVLAAPPDASGVVVVPASSATTTTATTTSATSAPASSVDLSSYVPEFDAADWPVAEGSDGRMAGDHTEYYTIYCESDQIKVYHSNGTLLNTIPIATVLGMNPDGATLDVGQGMTVARNGHSVTVAGSNGNRPEFGRKEFRIEECLARNGRVPTPVLSPTSPAVGQSAPPSTTSTQQVGQPLVETSGSPAIAAPVSGRTHTVRAGENLFRIALRYGVPLNTLAAVNRISNPALIYVGQVLVIP